MVQIPKFTGTKEISDKIPRGLVAPGAGSVEKAIAGIGGGIAKIGNQLLLEKKRSQALRTAFESNLKKTSFMQEETRSLQALMKPSTGELLDKPYSEGGRPVDGRTVEEHLAERSQSFDEELERDLPTDLAVETYRGESRNKTRKFLLAMNEHQFVQAGLSLETDLAHYTDTEAKKIESWNMKEDGDLEEHLEDVFENVSTMTSNARGYPWGDIKANAEDRASKRKLANAAMLTAQANEQVKFMMRAIDVEHLSPEQKKVFVKKYNKEFKPKDPVFKKGDKFFKGVGEDVGGNIKFKRGSIESAGVQDGKPVKTINEQFDTILKDIGIAIGPLEKSKRKFTNTPINEYINASDKMKYINDIIKTLKAKQKSNNSALFSRIDNFGTAVTSQNPEVQIDNETAKSTFDSLATELLTNPTIKDHVKANTTAKMLAQMQAGPIISENMKGVHPEQETANIEDALNESKASFSELEVMSPEVQAMANDPVFRKNVDERFVNMARRAGVMGRSNARKNGLDFLATVDPGIKMLMRSSDPKDRVKAEQRAHDKLESMGFSERENISFSKKGLADDAFKIRESFRGTGDASNRRVVDVFRDIDAKYGGKGQEDTYKKRVREILKQSGESKVLGILSHFDLDTEENIQDAMQIVQNLKAKKLGMGVFKTADEDNRTLKLKQEVAKQMAKIHMSNANRLNFEEDLEITAAYKTAVELEAIRIFAEGDQSDPGTLSEIVQGAKARVIDKHWETLQTPNGDYLFIPKRLLLEKGLTPDIIIDATGRAEGDPLQGGHINLKKHPTIMQRILERPDLNTQEKQQAFGDSLIKEGDAPTVTINTPKGIELMLTEAGMSIPLHIIKDGKETTSKVEYDDIPQFLRRSEGRGKVLSDKAARESVFDIRSEKYFDELFPSLKGK